MSGHRFDIWHLLILAAVVGTAGALTILVRRKPARERTVRLALAALIGAVELAWYVFVIVRGWFSPPFGLPLDLCDVVLWLTVAVLVRRSSRIFGVVYYWGLAGTTMALLMPDLAVPFTSLIAVKFFYTHGMVVTALLFLAWSGTLRPSPGSWWRAFLWLQAYAAVIGVFNAVFLTNYFYLCHKPTSGSLLDLFGAWPLYIVVSDVLAAGIFFLFSLRFREKGRMRWGNLSDFFLI